MVVIINSSNGKNILETGSKSLYLGFEILRAVVVRI
jgi:hypothetical protein